MTDNDAPQRPTIQQLSERLDYIDHHLTEADNADHGSRKQVGHIMVAVSLQNTMIQELLERISALEQGQ